MLIQDKENHIAVVELFAGVGGFRIGLEGASDAYETIWNNQWEPSTVHQDASLVYRARFGANGHSNQDINLVPTKDIPDHDLLVGGFPCQDYSVASTLSRSGGRYTVFLMKREKTGQTTYSSRMLTDCLAHLQSSEEGILQLSLPHCQI